MKYYNLTNNNYLVQVGGSGSLMLNFDKESSEIYIEIIDTILRVREDQEFISIREVIDIYFKNKRFLDIPEYLESKKEVFTPFEFYLLCYSPSETKKHPDYNIDYYKVLKLHYLYTIRDYLNKRSYEVLKQDPIIAKNITYKIKAILTSISKSAYRSIYPVFFGTDPYLDRYSKKITYLITYFFLIYLPNLSQLMSKINNDESSNFSELLRKSLEINRGSPLGEDFLKLQRVCGDVSEWVSQEDNRIKNKRDSTLKHIITGEEGKPDFPLIYYNNFYKICDIFYKEYASKLQLSTVPVDNIYNIIIIIDNDIKDLELYIKKKLEEVTMQRYEYSILKYHNEVDQKWMQDEVRYCSKECSEFFDPKRMQCLPEPDCKCECECTDMKMRLKRLYADTFKKSGIDVTKKDGFMGKVENIIDTGIANLDTDYEVKLHGNAMMDKIEYKIAQKIKGKKIGLKNKLQNIKGKLERKKRKVKEVHEKKEKVKEKWKKVKGRYKKAKKRMETSEKGVKRFFKGAKEIIDS